MSRSRKGKKAPGFEYWSRRPGNKHGGSPGSATKRHTHAVERQQGKQQSKQGMP